jgi:hypothetical protein
VTQTQKDGYRYPDLLEGLVPRGVRNLFIFGVGQPRYGAGPIITAGAESMASMLKAQAQVRTPARAPLHPHAPHAPSVRVSLSISVCAHDCVWSFGRR